MARGARSRESLAAFAIAALLGTVVGSASAQTPPSDERACTAYYEVLVVDISGSIAGLGVDPTATNILRDVKTSISAHLNGLGATARVGILPFGGKDEAFEPFPSGLTDPSIPQFANLGEPTARQRALQYVNGLDALGQSTHVVPAVDKALSALKDAQQRDPANRHCSALYLYTDGLDNEPGRGDWQREASDRLSTFRRQDLAYLFAAWVQMPGSGNQSCLKDGFNGGCGPLSLAQWRIKAPQPGALLDFGTLTDASVQSALKNVEFEEVAAAVVPAGAPPPSPKVTFVLTPGPSFDAEIAPGAAGLAASIGLSLRARVGQAVGDRTAMLNVGVQDAFLVGQTSIPIKYRFDRVPPPPPSPALWQLQSPSEAVVDFGVLSEASPVSSPRTLAFVELRPAVVGGGAPTGAPTVSLSVTTGGSEPLEAEVVPTTATLATRVDVALRAQPGQAAGERTGALHIATQGADWSGPTTIPIRYTYEVADEGFVGFLKIVIAVFAVLYTIGIAENFTSRKYQNSG